MTRISHPQSNALPERGRTYAQNRPAFRLLAKIMEEVQLTRSNSPYHIIGMPDYSFV